VVINESNIKIFRYQEYRHICTLFVPEITCFDINSDGSVLVTGSKTGEVKIWNISFDGDKTSITLRHTLTRHKSPVISIIFNRENLKISERENLSLFCISTDTSAILYNLSPEKKCEFIREFFLPHERFKSPTNITSLAFSKCGLMLTIGTNKNRVIHLLLLSTFEKKLDPTKEKKMEPYASSSSSSNYSGSINCMSSTRDGTLLVGTRSIITFLMKIPKTEEQLEYGYRSSIVQKIIVRRGCVNEIVSHSRFDIMCVSDSSNGHIHIYSISSGSPAGSLYELKFSLQNCFAEGIAFHPSEPILAIYRNIFDMESHQITKKICFYRLSPDCAILTLILMINL